MFVAVTSITKEGQPLYCVNPVKTTVDLGNAFWWRTKQEADMVLKESGEIYGTNAVVVEIVSTEQAKQRQLEAV